MSEIKIDGDVTTVVPSDKINAQNADELRSELRKIYEDGAQRIIIDLKHVGAIDSIGLGLLAATHNSLQKRGSKLELINADDEVCKLLNVMRLDRHFVITPAVDSSESA